MEDDETMEDDTTAIGALRRAMEEAAHTLAESQLAHAARMRADREAMEDMFTFTRQMLRKQMRMARRIARVAEELGDEDEDEDGGLLGAIMGAAGAR